MSRFGKGEREEKSVGRGDEGERVFGGSKERSRRKQTIVILTTRGRRLG